MPSKRTPKRKASAAATTVLKDTHNLRPRKSTVKTEKKRVSPKSKKAETQKVVFQQPQIELPKATTKKKKKAKKAKTVSIDVSSQSLICIQHLALTKFWNNGGGFLYKNRVSMLLHMCPPNLLDPNFVLSVQAGNTTHDLPLCIVVLLLKYHHSKKNAELSSMHNEIVNILERTLDNVRLPPFFYTDMLHAPLMAAFNEFYYKRTQLYEEKKLIQEFITTETLRKIRDEYSQIRIACMQTSVQSLFSNPVRPHCLPIDAMHAFRRTLFNIGCQLVHRQIVKIPSIVYKYLQLQTEDVRDCKYELFMNDGMMFISDYTSVVCLKLLHNALDPKTVEEIRQFLICSQIPMLPVRAIQLHTLFLSKYTTYNENQISSSPKIKLYPQDAIPFEEFDVEHPHDIFFEQKKSKTEFDQFLDIDTQTDNELDFKIMNTGYWLDIPDDIMDESNLLF